MIYQRSIAAILALAIAAAVFAAPQRKKKKKEQEEITQTLPVLPDPPAAVTADCERLTFRVAPLSAKGLLSQQVRDGLKALMRDSKGASIVKIRAFVAGTGDMRRVQTIVSETFSEKHLGVPAVTTVQGGALPGEGVQVALESIAVAKKPVSRHGLAFISGQPAATAEQSIERIETVLRAIAVNTSRVLQVSCFLSTLDHHSTARTAVAKAFPAAAMNFVQMQRLPVRTPIECEAVAALERAPTGRVELLNPQGIEASPNYSQAALVGPGRIVITGTQMGFGTEDGDIRLAFDRLGKSLEASQVTYKDVVFAHVYPVSEIAVEKFRAIRFSYLDQSRPPASTMLPFEGLPSLDASFGMDVIAVR